MKNTLEQLRSGFPRWSGEASPQLSARLAVPVNSSRLSTPRSSRKLLVQPNSPSGLAAGRNKRGQPSTAQSTPRPGGEEGTPNQTDAPPRMNAAAVAAAALSAAKPGSAEYGFSQTVQTTELKPQLNPNSRPAHQQAGYLAPSARTPSTPPAFARPTLQSPHHRGLATRRHSSAGAQFQQQEDQRHHDQQEQQMDLSQKRRVNPGHNVSQQSPAVESREPPTLFPS